MEHRKKGRKLKRTASHRKALLSNLAISLIKHKRIKTTLAKAKELRTYIEPYVTKAKNALGSDGSEKALHLRRVAASVIKDKEAIQTLFGDIAKKVENRNGGYTRILKTGFRYGDGASEAIIEFVDYSIIKDKEKAEKKKDETKTKGKKEEPSEVSVTEEPVTGAKVKKTPKPKAKKTTPAKEKTEKSKSKTSKGKETTKKTRKQEK